MAQIIRKWVQDSAINNEKIDEADVYTITGLRVDSTSAAGRVGIGITDPLVALHIMRSDASAGLMLDLNDGSNGRSYQLYSGSSGVMNIRDYDVGIDRFTLLSTASLGNVGISTVTPLDTLHARATISSAALRLDLDDGVSGQAYRFVSNSAGDLVIEDVDATATRMTIDSTGTTIIPGDTTVGGNFEVDGTVTVINTEIVITDQLEINQTDATQSALIASQDNVAATETVVKIENVSSAHALTVDQGNVGFSTTDPQAELHVEGDIVGKVTATPSNLGSTSRRIGTIYMASNVDYVSNLAFNSGGTKVTFDSTNGRVGIGSTLPDQPLTVIGNVRGSTTITAGTGITATTGNIVAVAGAVNANTTVTAGTGVTATTGNIEATTGNIEATTGDMTAGATILAGTGITSTLGNIVAAAGAVNANTTVTAGTGVTATTGNIEATTGDMTAGATILAGTKITATTLLSGNSLSITEDSDVGRDATVGMNLIVTGSIDVENGSIEALSGSIQGASVDAVGTLSGGDLSITLDSDVGRDSTVGNDLIVNADIISDNGSISALSGSIQGASVDAVGTLSGGSLSITLDSDVGRDATVGMNLIVTGSIDVENGSIEALSGSIQGASVDAVGTLSGGDLSITLDSDVGRDSTVGNDLIVNADIISDNGSISALSGSIQGASVDAVGTLSGGSLSITLDSDIGRDATIGGVLSKGSGSFLIDHPLDPDNKVLRHSFVESPEMRNVYYGQTETIKDSATITLPYWWTALNGNNKSEYTYQLTPMGKWAQLYVSQEIEDNQFTVSSVDGNCKFSWTVSAIRHDKHAEEHRVIVEEEKSEDMKEKSIHRNEISKL